MLQSIFFSRSFTTYPHQSSAMFSIFQSVFSSALPTNEKWRAFQLNINMRAVRALLQNQYGFPFFKPKTTALRRGPYFLFKALARCHRARFIIHRGEENGMWDISSLASTKASFFLVLHFLRNGIAWNEEDRERE